MGVAGQSLPAGASDLSELSDEELIRRFCQDRSDPSLIRHVYERHADAVSNTLRKLINVGRLCPERWDFETFFGECWSYTYCNVVARICGFAFRGSFDGWLARVARTSALDAYSRLSRDPARPLPDTIDLGAADAGGDTLGADEGSGASNRSRSLPAHWWLKPDWIRSAETEIMKVQRARVVEAALKYHAFTSEENAESSRVIRWRYKKDWPVSKIAVVIYGNPQTQTEKETRERRVFHKLTNDHKKLQALLAERFGIASLRDV